MKTAKKIFPSLLISALFVVPLLASAATVSTAEHPAPPLPPGAKVGVVSAPPSSTSPTVVTSAAPSANTPVPGAAPDANSLTYVGGAVAVLVVLVLGFFLGKKK